MLTINGANPPAPSAMKISIFNVGAQTERTASGRAVIDRVGVKRKIELKWAHLSPADMRSLLTAVGSDAFFSVTYPDPATGAARTMQCCCEERKTGILRMADGAPVWVDAGFTLIER